MKFLMNGSLYQGSKPVMWSPVEKTALAEAEVEYHDKPELAVWVKFEWWPMPGIPREDSAQGPGCVFARRFANRIKPPGNGCYLSGRTILRTWCAKVVIWTTTPWTMPQNRRSASAPRSPTASTRSPAAPRNAGRGSATATFWPTRWPKSAALSRAAGSWHVPPPARRDGRRTGGAQPAPIPCAARGRNGEWDFRRAATFRAGRFRDRRREGTGLRAHRAQPRDEDYELGRDLGMLEMSSPTTSWTTALSATTCRSSAASAILKPNGKEGDANKAVIDKLVEVGGCWRAARSSIPIRIPGAPRRR
jgi:isoleucyl-tRNA synthetase